VSAGLFELLAAFAPEELHVVRRRDLGLTAFIALDDTRLGPACGGIRWRAYARPEDGAHDVLRLARTMTYKNAFAGLDFGGGKTVVLRDPAMDPARAFPALGEAIEGLGGRYVTACDYGTTARELALVKSRTGYALAEAAAGALDLGTATGVLVAIRAVWRRLAGAGTLAGARVVVQGVGDVGLPLVRLLREAGAAVAFAEVDEAKAERCRAELGVPRVPAEAVLAADMDVFAPCAVGEVITEAAARSLRARGIAGAANNQLASEAAGTVLRDRGILYVPDFVANAGAVIVGFETGAGRAATALDAVRRIEERVERVLDHAAAEGTTTTAAAIRLARARLDAARRQPGAP
jgi:glutamate dehydrogenase/leucine dehydrogenase